MSLPLVRNLGRWAIDRSQIYTEMARILARIIAALLRLSVFNPAILFVLVRQIYFTAVQPLTIIIVAALVLGSITVHILLQALLSLGAYEQIGDYLITAMLHHIAPIICTLIIVLRSGTAVITEMALMKINREIDTLGVLAVPVDEYLYLPRFLAFVIAGPCLSFCFCVIGLLGGFLTLGFLHDITFANYMDRLLQAVHISDVLNLIVKTALLGGLVCLVALQRGLSVQGSFTEVPVRLIQGMIQIVTMVIAVKVLFNLF